VHHSALFVLTQTILGLAPALRSAVLLNRSWSAKISGEAITPSPPRTTTFSAYAAATNTSSPLLPMPLIVWLSTTWTFLPAASFLVRHSESLKQQNAGTRS
jgi:hypothetical protein